MNAVPCKYKPGDLVRLNAEGQRCLTSTLCLIEGYIYTVRKTEWRDKLSGGNKNYGHVIIVEPYQVAQNSRHIQKMITDGFWEMFVEPADFKPTMDAQEYEEIIVAQDAYANLAK